MATIARLCLALVVAGFFAASQLAAADPIARLQFSDGVSRTSADFAGQHVLLYQFSGH